MSARLKNNQRFLMAFTAILILAGTALPAAAEIIIVPAACRAGGTECTLCHMGELVINLTNFLMKTIAFPAAVLLLVVGGLMLMISGASEERRTMGKKILTSTLIGLIIVMLAWMGVDTIIKILTGKFNLGGERGSLFANFKTKVGNFGPWNKIDPTGCPL